MEKEFVPYELAVKLKTLGFDEDCFGCYTKEGKLSYDFSDNRGEGHYFQECSAPTYSQTFRWFREKYGLYDTISKNGYMIEGETNSGFLRITRLTLNSHEEAELACLDKLIEIVEQKEK
jgi:hypothetical protein